MNKVLILMGSDSDLTTMEPAVKMLKELEVEHEVHVSSAHRTPNRTQELVIRANDEFAVIIAAAGCAAHLAGFCAAHSNLPVIGVPIAGSLGGMDALLSTVQMPSGIPVACMAIGKAGAKNAAILAAQIISINSEKHRDILQKMRQAMAAAVEKKDQRLQEKL